MATYYVDDGGSDTDPFDTYAKAASSLSALETAKAPYTAGDEIHIGHDHQEQIAGNTTYNFANGTEAAPVRLISTNTGTDAYQAGAKIDTDGGGFDVLLGSGWSSWYGVTIDLVPGDDFSVTGSNIGHEFHECSLEINDLLLGFASAEETVKFYNCTITCPAVGGPFINMSAESYLLMRGCSVTINNANAAEPIVENISDGTVVLFEDCDFSACTATMALAEYDGTQSNTFVTYRRCKLPATFAMPTIPVGNNKFFMESCSVAAIAAPLLGIGGKTDVDGWSSIQGTIGTTTTQARTGGASDGTNLYAWEVKAAATASFFTPLELPPITYWAEAGAQTVTIHTADGADLNDDELWMELSYPDGDPQQPDNLISTASTRNDPLDTPQAVPRDAGSTWAGAGTGTDGGTGQQKLSWGSINPDYGGPVVIRIFVAKASATMYVDPRPVIS